MTDVRILAGSRQEDSTCPPETRASQLAVNPEGASKISRRAM